MHRPTKAEYVALASFRRELRTFLRFAEQSARKAGITPQQHQVLLAVAGQPERDWASVSEIRDALQVAHHAAVGLVDRCQTAGLVGREHDPNDRRVVRVALTEEGRRMLAVITDANLRELRGAESLLSELNRLLPPSESGMGGG